MRTRMLGSLVTLACLLSPQLGRTDDAKRNPAAAPATPAKPLPPGPKPVKQETRAELETEVEQLRAENAQLKKNLNDLYAREKERARRLQEQLGGAPSTTLK